MIGDIQGEEQRRICFESKGLETRRIGQASQRVEMLWKSVDWALDWKSTPTHRDGIVSIDEQRQHWKER